MKSQWEVAILAPPLRDRRMSRTSAVCWVSRTVPGLAGFSRTENEITFERGLTSAGCQSGLERACQASVLEMGTAPRSARRLGLRPLARVNVKRRFVSLTP